MTGHCNRKSGAHVQAGWQLDFAGCVPVDDSIQVWRHVVESAWHAGWLSLPVSVWLEHSSLPGGQHHAGGSLYLSQSGSSTPPQQSVGLLDLIS